jgi:3-methylfumaryl-CoA hydratase
MSEQQPGDMNWQSWTGRSESVSEAVGPGPAAAMAATLDRPLPPPGSSLPALWHWMYCVKVVPQSSLAEDGHPRRGEFIPPVPQEQRMWAGSKLEFSEEISIGDVLTRDSRIVDIREAAGSSGEMVFVTLENQYRTGRGLAIRELQDIVYRHRPAESGQARQRQPIALATEAVRPVCPDPRLLFRYSALTFNAHRIHYDLPYAREVEGYAGLVVHGPLLATLLMDFWEGMPGRPVLRSLAIRALAPALAGERLELCVGEAAVGQQTLWVQREGGDPLLRIELDFAKGKP